MKPWDNMGENPWYFHLEQTENWKLLYQMQIYPFAIWSKMGYCPSRKTPQAKTTNCSKGRSQFVKKRYPTIRGVSKNLWISRMHQNKKLRLRSNLKKNLPVFQLKGKAAKDIGLQHHYTKNFQTCFNRPMDPKMVLEIGNPCILSMMSRNMNFQKKRWLHNVITKIL